MAKSKKAADSGAEAATPGTAQERAVSLARALRAGIGVRYDRTSAGPQLAEVTVRAPEGLAFADGSTARVWRANSAPSLEELWADVERMLKPGARPPVSGAGADDPTAQLEAHGLEVLTR